MKLTQEDVTDWIKYKATGVFYYRHVLDGQVPPELFHNLRTYCMRAVEYGFAAKINGRDGYFRPIDKSMEEIILDDEGDIKEAGLKLPLGLHDYAYIFSPSLIIVAGVWLAGKTAYLINVLNQNCETFENNMFFFVSEAPELLKMRFKNLAVQMPRPLPFKIYKRMDNFSDVIEPDGLNIIDYLRTDMKEPYAVSNELKLIYQKLKTGIAVVGMQKPTGERKIAYGGESTAWEPALYIAIDKGFASFVKIRTPKIFEPDPYRIKFTYKIRHGVNFEDISTVVE